MHYLRWWKFGDPAVILPQQPPPRAKAKPADERFWKHVTKTETCWLWTTALSKDGYGIFKFEGAMRGAHLFLVGRPPRGYEWDHLCYTRHCVRPEHLELVTHGENIRRSHARRGHIVSVV
jgi:hypothetical protein